MAVISYPAFQGRITYPKDPAHAPKMGPPARYPSPTVAFYATAIAGATIGVPYSQTFSGTGGTTPYSWTVTGGSLPTGCTLNASTGVVSGTPTAAGTFTFTIKITDANGVNASETFSVIVSAGGGGNFGWIG